MKHTSVLKCSLYFVSFYILTDTILLNLLVALVLEAYEQASLAAAAAAAHRVSLYENIARQETYRQRDKDGGRDREEGQGAALPFLVLMRRCRSPRCHPRNRPQPQMKRRHLPSPNPAR